MVKIPGKILTWQMIQPTSRNIETGEVIPGKLEKKEIPVPELKTGEVLVEIEGCGLRPLGLLPHGAGSTSRTP